MWQLLIKLMQGYNKKKQVEQRIQNEQVKGKNEHQKNVMLQLGLWLKDVRMPLRRGFLLCTGLKGRVLLGKTPFS